MQNLDPKAKSKKKTLRFMLSNDVFVFHTYILRPVRIIKIETFCSIFNIRWEFRICYSCKKVFLKTIFKAHLVVLKVEELEKHLGDSILK